MSMLSIRHPQSMDQYIGAWAVSVAAHGLALGLFVALVTTLHLPPDPNLFRWEVTMVETPEQAAETASAQLEATPPPPVPDRLQESPALATPPSRTVPVQAQQIQRQIEKVETVQVIERTNRIETVRTVHMSKPIAHQEIESVTALPQEVSVSDAQPTLESAPVINQPLQTTAKAVQTPLKTATRATVDNPAISRETRSVQEAAIVASSSMPHQTSVVTHDQPAKSDSETGLQHIQVETRSLATRPLAEAKAVLEPSRLPVPDKTGAVKTDGSVGMRKNKPAFIKLEASPERSASFEWLTEAIKRSETRRRPFADHEGTTHFRITMRQDGRTMHLLDLSVTESSGYAQVDRAAADLIRRSFPIELTEPLAQSQVRIDLPVTIHTN